MKFNYYLLLCFGLLLGLQSCLNKVDVNNVNDLEYRAEWAVPLVQAKLELKDLVANDSNFVVDPDNGIRIVYQEDSIAGIALADLIEIPDQDPELLSLHSGTPPVIQDVDLESLGGVELKYMSAKSGKLAWKVENSVNFPVSFEVAITNATVNGDTAIFFIDAIAGGVTNGFVDISGLFFDLTTGVYGFNNLTYRIIITDDGGAPVGSQYDISVQLTELEVNQAIGYFGERSIPLPSKILESKIGSFENILSGIRIENPLIELSINGNIGIPIDFEPDFDGVNKLGFVTALEIPNISYVGPTAVGSWTNSDYSINKDNSNIVDFIASLPNDISFAGNVLINPNGKTGHDNFVNLDGEIKVGMNIEIPLEFKVKNLILEQWLYDVDWGVEDDDQDLIEKLKLHFKVTNGFPFDANLKMVFYDKSSDLPTDSVNVNLLTSAVVDANGKVIEPTLSRSLIEFDNVNISNLLNSNKIRLLITLNSFNEGQDIVKLYTTDFINVAIGIQTKINL